MSAVQDTIKVAEDMAKSAEDTIRGLLFQLNEAKMQDQRRIARETAPLRDEIRRLQHQVDTLKAENHRETAPLHDQIRRLHYQVDTLTAENQNLRATHRAVNSLTTLPR
jgi:predicted RNase H-like nuclease (RuvC/YqgF family)